MVYGFTILYLDLDTYITQITKMLSLTGSTSSPDVSLDMIEKSLPFEVSLYVGNEVRR